MALLQSAPLVLLLLLLASGRAGPVGPCLAALVAALPGLALTLPGGPAATPAFLLEEAARAVFLGLQPVAVLTGGLVFHLAVSRLQRQDGVPPAATPRRVLAATLLGGSFVESVTGFAVGAVFALAALRRMGIGGAPAGALALLALAMVPWGGLGPGTALGAALVHVPPQVLAQATALPHAAWLLCLPFLLWHLCALVGLPVLAAEKRAQWSIVAGMAMLLLLANRWLPFEVAGIVASGLPLLGVLWRLDPPRSRQEWWRAGVALAPWTFLTVMLLLARSWRSAPAFQPWPDLPPLPVSHVAVVLWLVAAMLLALRPAGAARAARQSLRRASRPALAMLLYVLLGRWLAGSGMASALANSAATMLGPLAVYALPPMALVSGLVTGSNVASNAALMPVQVALGSAAGLPALLAAGLHNAIGAAAAGMSIGVTAMIAGLLGGNTRPLDLWRHLWPSMLALLLVGWVRLWLPAF
jgi:lactate permease